MDNPATAKIHVTPSDIATHVRIASFDASGNFITYEEKAFSVLLCELSKYGKSMIEGLENDVICITFSTERKEEKKTECEIM